MHRDDRRDAAAAERVVEVASRLGILAGLKRNGREWVGPCPDCGGHDRFSINEAKNVINCRKCAAAGGPIDLVMLTLRCSFREALDYLVGAAEITLSPEEQKKRRDRVAAEKRRRDDEAASWARRAVELARGIWRQCRPAEDSPVRDYLALRGLTRDRLPEIPPSIRFHPNLPYMVDKPGGGYVEAYRGPAMVAAIIGARFGGAVHRTWIDLDQPKGKARIEHDGRFLDPKKMLGSKKGGHIALHDPPDATVLVMGEGIETTLSARVSWPLEWAYWAGGDLGNMSGRVLRGKGLKYKGLPDMTDVESFIPPERFKRLLYIGDSEKDAAATEAQLMAGIRRAMRHRPGLTGSVVPAGGDSDLNDRLMFGEKEEGMNSDDR